ncbi:MAG TPA: peptidylprolyl isomerase [Caulobacterales bacterium]|nr:peptidylprolyl isomerase [Caulobacterales bacterium]
MNWKTLCAAAVAVSALAVLPARAQLAESVAAVVNDKVISTYDVRQRATLLLVSAGLQPTPELQQRANAQALQDLIDEELELGETGNDHYHITVSDADVDRRLEGIAQQNNLTKDAFLQQLAQQGVGADTLRHQIRADTAWQRLMSGLYGSRIRVSEQEIRDTQARAAASATRPRYLVSEIFLPASNPQQFQDMANGAQRLMEQMQHGVPFPAVARQFSAAPSAAAGGDMGWLAESELQPEILGAVQRLQPNQMAIVQTPNGIYIVALRERREGVAASTVQQVSLRQITAPAERRAQLERIQRRMQGCNNLDQSITGIDGAEITDLGTATESDLSEAIRTRITDVPSGGASPVAVDGDQASMIVVCSRLTGGGAVPNRDEIEDRLYQQEMAMLSERYLRNLRREATIITR